MFLFLGVFSPQTSSITALQRKSACIILCNTCTDYVCKKKKKNSIPCMTVRADDNISMRVRIRRDHRVSLQLLSLRFT